MTVKKRILPLFAALAVAASGCSLMHDDLQKCPSGVDLKFVYDYNIDRADMFPAHVGAVTVYVFDEQGKFLTSKEEYNTATNRPLASPLYTMHLDLEPGKYSFIALAHQRSYNECLAGKGAKYRRTVLNTTHAMTDLGVTLDRTEGFVDSSAPLDTLWHGMGAQPIVVRDMEAASQTISLMRDTKNLTVSLHNLDAPANIDIQDFDISITAANGKIGYDNTLLDDEALTYTPYALWNTEFGTAGRAEGETTDDTDHLERTAHAALAFNRIMHYPAAADNARNAMLTITNRTTGKTVARINLPDCLAQGRGAFEHLNYSPQEFLDREHDYKLDFFLRGDTWQYVELSISVLAWSKRIQNIKL